MYTQEQKKNIPVRNLEFVCPHCPYKCKVSIAKIENPKHQITDDTVYTIDELGTKWAPTFKSAPSKSIPATVFTTYIDENNEKQSTLQDTALEALELAKNTMIPLCDHYQKKQ